MNGAQRFVDVHAVDPNAVRFLCLDARGGWARADAITQDDVVLVHHMRPADADVIRAKLRDAGLGYQVERGAALYASAHEHAHRPCADPGILRVGDAAILSFDAPPYWGAVADTVRGCRLVTGTFGFDPATQAGLAKIVARVLGMQRVPGAVAHAYADADYVDAAALGPWVAFRCVWEYHAGAEGVPLMGAAVMRARDNDALVRDLRSVASDPRAVDVVRLVRKRNYDSDNQPQWDTVRERCAPAVWERLFALNIVRRVRDVLIATPRAKLVLLLAQG